MNSFANSSSSWENIRNNCANPFPTEQCSNLVNDIQCLSIHKPKARRAILPKFKIPGTETSVPETNTFVPTIPAINPPPDPTSLPVPRSEDHNYFWPILFFLLLPISVVFLSVAFNQEDLVKQFCAPTMNFTKAAKEIESRVYGQEKAVTQLLEFLETKMGSGFSTLALVGGTGVGKSHTANLMQNNLPRKHSVLRYSPPFLGPSEDEAYEALSTCGCNLVILENSRVEDIDTAAAFAGNLKTRSPNYCVLILAIFNTQTISGSFVKDIDLEGSKRMIEESFAEKELEVEVVVYEYLDSDALNKCIAEAAKDLKIQLSKREVDYIRQGLVLAQSGCKGAYSKAQLFAKRNEIV